MKLLFPEPQKLSLLLIDSCVQTINISKTKGSNSDRFTMSSMVVKHSYISCECSFSLFSAHSLINSLFVGYQLKAKHRWSFLFIPALCSCVTVKWMLFYVCSIFYTVCRIGSLLSALILISFLLCVGGLHNHSAVPLEEHYILLS